MARLLPFHRFRWQQLPWVEARNRAALEAAPPPPWAPPRLVVPARPPNRHPPRPL